MSHTERMYESVVLGTADEFTAAINLSFEPIARIGSIGIRSLYAAHADTLPFDVNAELDAGEPEVDVATMQSLNALHILVEARRAKLQEFEPNTRSRATYETVWGENAVSDVITEVCRTQQRLAESLHGLYLNTSVLGANPDSVVGIDR